MDKKINQKGAVSALLLIVGLGLVVFIVISSAGDFKNGIFAKLFQKPSSFALSGPVSAPIRFVTPYPRSTSSATPNSTLRQIPKKLR